MDTNVAGLNKVYCFTNSSSYNGKTVSITDGINTWLEVLDELSCVFQIPSIPAPAKRRYTVTLHNGDETQSALYQRVVDLGFGDSIRIGLYQNDEIVKVGSVPKATNSRIGGIKAVDSSNTQYGVYMNGDYLQLRTADSSYIGGVKVSDTTANGLYMSNGGIYLRTASTTQKGGAKVGWGLTMASEAIKLNLKEANALGSLFSLTVAAGGYATKDCVYNDKTLHDAILTGKGWMDFGVLNTGALLPVVEDYGASGSNETHIYMKFYNISNSQVTVNNISVNPTYKYFE